MAVTAYRVIKAPIEQIDDFMAEAIKDGWQPLGSPFSQRPASDTIYQAVIKGTPAGGGGGPVNITINDIMDAGDTGKALMAAEDEAAGRSAIGAISASDIPAAPTWDELKPPVVAAGDTEAAARQAIGAGTGNSDLELGSGANQAAPGNHGHSVSDIGGLDAALADKADQSDLNTLAGEVEGKADASALADKADQADLNALVSRVEALENAEP